MTANFGFVFHTAERHAHIFAPESSGNGLGNRGLAHSRRPCKADDGRFFAARQGAHSQKFHNALLNLFHAVVVFIKNLSRHGEVFIFFVFDIPWYLSEPVEIAPDDGGIGVAGLHAFKP